MMSFASRPVEDLLADRRVGSTRQASDWVHGMWTKWCRKASGRARRTSAGQRVEVVVVDHHDRLLVALDLLDHRAREVLVDDVVAELEGLDLLAADVRRVGEVPQVVLDEPQHRVRERRCRSGRRPSGSEATRRTWYAPPSGSSTAKGLPPCSREARRRPRPSSPTRSRSPRGARRGPSAPSRARRRRAAPRRRRSNVTGPRLETRTSGAAAGRRSGALPLQRGEDPQPVAQQARHQEVRAHVLLAGAPESLAELRVARGSRARAARTPRRCRRGSPRRRPRSAAGSRRRCRR